MQHTGSAEDRSRAQGSSTDSRGNSQLWVSTREADGSGARAPRWIRWGECLRVWCHPAIPFEHQLASPGPYCGSHELKPAAGSDSKRHADAKGGRPRVLARPACSRCVPLPPRGALCGRARVVVREGTVTPSSCRVNVGGPPAWRAGRLLRACPARIARLLWRRPARMSTLALKLGTLFIKQLSKPLASSFTSVILASPSLRPATVKLARVRPVALLPERSRLLPYSRSFHLRAAVL